MKPLTAFAAGVCMLVFNSCYVVSQAGPFLSHRLRAVPVEELLEREDLDDDIRGMLLEVRRIRSFARNELGLSSSENYRKLVFLDRDYLAAVIQAAPEFSTDPHLFWYPFIGKQPYRGYYDPEDARVHAKKLEKKGLDIFVRKVDAFSSLGFFKDPLYSFMAQYSRRRLAELIIHEETHATVFFKKYPGFNEKLATVAGVQGADLYMKTVYPEEYSPEERRVRKEKREIFQKDIFLLAEELEELYGSGASPREMRRRKVLLFDAFEKKWELSFDVNNAFVSLYNLYEEPDNRVLEAYRHLGSVSRLITLCMELEERGEDPWKAISSLNLIN